MIRRVRWDHLPIRKCLFPEVVESQGADSCRCYSTITTVEKAQAATARSTIERIRERIREIERQKGPPPGPLPSIQQTVCSTDSLEEVKKKVLSPNAFMDTFGRAHTYLRISLTERCNLRCLYCMPEEGVQLSPKGSILTTEEVIRLARLFASHGVNKIRLTGGEPTLRKDLVDIVRQISQIPGIEDIGLTTNGIMLHKHIMALRDAGLTKVNISLDTLKQDRYIEMCRRNGFGKVLESIKAVESLYPYVKINVVVMRGKNDDEIMDFIRMTQARRIDVRYIEFMPFGGNHFNQSHFISAGEILQRIKQKFGDGNVHKMTELPNDTARSFKIGGFTGQFGFISSMSDHFCFTCNRLRLTADGNLKVCLHGNAEVSLRDLMRKEASDEQLSQVIQAAVKRKKAKHAGMENLMTLPNRPMILIGG